MAEPEGHASAPPGGAREKEPGITPRASVVLLVVLTLVVAGYTGVLDAPLLWDDVPLLEHPTVSRLAPLGQYLFAPFWDRSQEGGTEVLFYRPLTTLSLALDRAWHGRNPTGFHLTNLALHLANVTCVFFLARRMRAPVLAAAAGALVWGLLPRLAECVSWVSGRTDELGALGVLGALLVWRRGDVARLALASVLGFLAMLGKEMGVAAPLALAVGELWPRPERKAWLRALLPLSLLGVYLALRHVAVGELTGPALMPLGPGGRLLTVLESVGRYAWMTVDMWHPATQIGVVGRPSVPFVVLGAAALLASGGLLWRVARRIDGAWAALVVAGSVPVLLVIHAIPLPWMVVACDRLMYLPWAVAAVAAATGASRLRLGGWHRRVAIAATALLVPSLLFATRARAAVFADEVEFWVDALETTPADNWLPTFSVNELYARGGLYRESLVILQSLEERPPQPVDTDLSLLLARALDRLGRYEEAHRVRRAVRLEPSAAALMDAAVDALHRLEHDRAEKLAQQALGMQPRYERAERLLGSIAEIRHLERWLGENPAPGLDRDVVRARRDTLAGRGPEAEAAWLALLARPELPSQRAHEGFAFVAELGSHAALGRALATYAARPDASAELVIAARDRLSFGDRLAQQWPRVVRALERLRGAPLTRPSTPLTAPGPVRASTPPT